jgi:hypothetical protein
LIASAPKICANGQYSTGTLLFCKVIKNTCTSHFLKAQKQRSKNFKKGSISFVSPHTISLLENGKEQD